MKTPLKAALCGLLLVTSTFAQTVIGWGDSLTGGAYAQTTWTVQFQALSGLTTINRGVGGNTSTQILTRFNAEPALWSNFTVIEAGRNNYSDSATVQADIASMVASLGHQNYLVLSIIGGNYGNEDIGDTGWTQITNLNSALQATYTTHYVDYWNPLIDAYDPLNAQDVIDHAAGIVPSSLRMDNIHLTTAGYGVMAQEIYAGYLNLTAVPEPGTYALLAGLVGLGLAMWRKRSVA